MPSSNSATTDELLRRVRRGDESARHALLARHRPRLIRMVSVRLDRRMTARFDPSDVVQDALIEADRRLDDYMSHPTVPFYAWLRQFAWQRLVELRRRHLQAKRRSVTREQPPEVMLPGKSSARLADQLLASTSQPLQHLIREELRARIQKALKDLAPRDREVLVLRYLEQLSTAEIAGVLEITEGAVRTRHVRALDRLRHLLEDE